MDISYLHGRAVESVLSEEDAAGYDADAAWGVKLEAEGYIFCFDKSHEPPVLDGLALTTSVVTDTEARLYFGTDDNPTGTMIVMRLDEYGVMDNLYSEGAVVHANAQPPLEATESPVAASETGGTPDGPSEEFLAAEATRRTQAESVAEAVAPENRVEDDDGA